MQSAAAVWKSWLVQTQERSATLLQPADVAAVLEHWRTHALMFPVEAAALAVPVEDWAAATAARAATMKVERIMDGWLVGWIRVVKRDLREVVKKRTEGDAKV